eukprot:maker-scaffold180_size281610-snap-gene-0.26 protein:Tk11857 transcript:maker-scaffold180_size281610-snap-gene-0.26-mRNA-1 annotation:"-like protein subfamily c member 10"
MGEHLRASPGFIAARSVYVAVTIFLLLATTFIRAEDYYKILGVGKEANNREIRKAFKKLALQHHPDKSKEENAQEKFLKITKAYETLKDEDKRKRYDKFGEEDGEDGGNGGSKSNSRGYQSWNYYYDDFGLYDDDPEIITLDYHDYRRSVSESFSIWFINFYSPQCGHCHDIAPTWRRLAQLLDGIIRVGAVNCQDDMLLCRQQNIHAYPSLLFVTSDGPRRYRGEMDEESLLTFVADNLPNQVFSLSAAKFQKSLERGLSSVPWMVLFCTADDFKCPEVEHRRLLAHKLGGIVNVAHVDCSRNEDEKAFCAQFEDVTGETTQFVLYKGLKDVLKQEGGQVLDHSSGFKAMAEEVMEKLPEVKILDDEAYAQMRLKLEDGMGTAWLIHFIYGRDGQTKEDKLIGSKVPQLKFGVVDCFDQASSCQELHLKTPHYVLFKRGGAFEIYHGRESPEDLAQFARIGAQAVTMTTMGTSDFPEILESAGVFIDFFAPWCPPCLNLLPEFRKASLHIGGSIMFGTVDCTVHTDVCNRFNIRSYPTTIFYNQSKPHYYHGDHSAGALSEFVHDVLKPTVINLDYAKYHQLVEGKSSDDLWLVDFYAPWCGPCMQLAPEWSKMAKLLKKIPEVKVGKVDCTAEPLLCQENFIRSYPTLRMFPLGSTGTERYLVYTAFNRDAHSLRTWAMEHLPEFVENFTPFLFKQEVVNADKPTLIEFYTPWCGHCQHFAPVFEDVALSLRGEVTCAKINCDRFQNLCRDQGVKGYPTVKFYLGLSDAGMEVKSRQPDKIVSFAESELVKRKRHRNHDEL